MRIVFVIAACAVLGASLDTAHATIFESEPNDSIATAQLAFSFPLQHSEAVLGSLAPGDVDFYRIELTHSALVTANLFDFTPTIPDDHDSILGLFDSTGALIAFDDDGGPGLMSVLFFLSLGGGTFYVGVSGGGDDGFNGEHTQDFNYKLVFNSTPAPGALLLLVVGCLRASRRRPR